MHGKLRAWLIEDSLCSANSEFGGDGLVDLGGFGFSAGEVLTALDESAEQR